MTKYTEAPIAPRPMPLDVNAVTSHGVSDLTAASVEGFPAMRAEFVEPSGPPIHGSRFDPTSAFPPSPVTPYASQPKPEAKPSTFGPEGSRFAPTVLELNTSIVPPPPIPAFHYAEREVAAAVAAPPEKPELRQDAEEDVWTSAKPKNDTIEKAGSDAEPATEQDPFEPPDEFVAKTTDELMGEKPVVTTAKSDEQVEPAGCSSCGNGPLPQPMDGAVYSTTMDSGGGDWSMGCSSCGAGRDPCTPGLRPCYPIQHHTVVGRTFEELYHCICCPDPCYEPQWIPLANAAFFVDPVRPKTQQTFRWEHQTNLRTPDRAEYYFARYSTYVGDGPLPPVPPPTTPPYVDTSVEFNELVYYAEAGTPKFSAFVETPYRSIDPNVSDFAAGFGDLKIGTKTMLFECELIQIAFQFRTHLPVGISFKGLGTGHTTLEPSLITAIKLHPEIYLQTQLTEWIPLSADASQAGAVLELHSSLNALLWCLNPDVLLIGTLEYSGWAFQDGQYINPYLDPANPLTYSLPASGQVYSSFGPGLRMSICRRIDFGIGTLVGLGTKSWSDFAMNMEMRVLF